MLPALLLVCGLVAAWTVAFAQYRAERDQADRLMARQTDLVRIATDSEAHRYVDLLAGLAGALQAVPEVDSAAFATAVEPLRRARLPGARAIAFVVPASTSEVPGLERRWSTAGVPPLVLHPDPGRDQHLFAVLVQSLDAVETPVSGVDAAALPQLGETLRAASQADGIRISAPHVLNRDRQLPVAQRQLSFLLAAPVRTATGPGWVVLGLRGQDFLGSSLKSLAQGPLDASLWSRDAAGQEVEVARVEAGRSGRGQRPDHTGSAVVRVAQQVWTLRTAASGAELTGGTTAFPLTIGGAGTVLTLLLAGLIRLLAAGRAREQARARAASDGLDHAERELGQAEAELTSQAALLCSVLDSISDGVAVVDQDGELLLSNPAAKRMLGLGSSRAGSLTQWQQRYGPLRRDGQPFPDDELPLARALAGEDVEQVEMIFPSADGRELTLRVSAAPLDPAGEHTGAVAIFHDVTGIKRADAKFRGLLEAAPDALVGTDREGRIELVNRAAEQLFGYRREELLGAEIELLLPQAARDLHRGHRAGYLDRPRVGPMSPRAPGPDGPLLGRRRDGSEFPVEVTLSTLPGEAAGPDGHTLVVAAVRDSTAWLNQQQALEDLNGRLEERVRDRTRRLEEQAALLRATNEELEAFSSSISHDLRAPLRSVAGFARIVERDHGGSLDETGRRHLAKVRESTIRMGTMIDGLLTFSRLQRQALNVRPVRLAPLVEEAWADLAEERGDRVIELTVDDLPKCSADARLLRHVLGNLLSNAIKYTRDRERARVRVSGRRDEHGVAVFSVADNGVGFDPRYAAKLFEIFQRLHRDEDYEGTGVGLALTARIVRRHGGRIWADSAPDAGATFSFTLSGAPAPAGPVDLDRAAGPPVPGRQAAMSPAHELRTAGGTA